MHVPDRPTVSATITQFELVLTLYSGGTCIASDR